MALHALILHAAAMQATSVGTIYVPICIHVQACKTFYHNNVKQLPQEVDHNDIKTYLPIDHMLATIRSWPSLVRADWKILLWCCKPSSIREKTQLTVTQLCVDIPFNCPQSYCWRDV